MNYREIAVNYYYDRFYFDSIEEYVQENNLQLNIKTLKFYITVESNLRDKNKKIDELTKLFTTNTAIQFSNNANNTKKAIYHPCTKNNGNKYQISFIDDLGAEMDIAADTITNIVEKFISFYSKYNVIDKIA